MKILIIGIDGAGSELLFGDERLVTLRRLMEWGCYGRLEGVIPPARVPVWMCLSASQDPGSLGMYGFRDCAGDSSDDPGADATSASPLTMWDQVARQGKRTNIIGAPLERPPRPVSGVWVGEFPSPDPGRDVYVHPAGIREEIERLVGRSPVKPRERRVLSQDGLKDRIYSETRQRFGIVRHFLQHSEWDYFQFVETGPDQLHRRFWRYHDPQHVVYEPDTPYEGVIRDYYWLLDEEVGRILELLSEDAVVLVVSARGPQRLDGGFCLNQWLAEEGLLALNEHPQEITPFGQLDVNWERTRAWSQGAGLFLNVKGRQPNGTIDQADYQKVREELRARVEAIEDDRGQPVNPRVFEPEEIYQTVRGAAPDLIVQFEDPHWRAISSVGYPTVRICGARGLPGAERAAEKSGIRWSAELDDCAHSRFGAFILAATNNPLSGRIEGARLLDIAPTLLELGGYDIPASMQGTSLVAGRMSGAQGDTRLSADEEEAIRQRLSGLGYIS